MTPAQEQIQEALAAVADARRLLDTAFATLGSAWHAAAPDLSRISQLSISEDHYSATTTGTQQNGK